MSIIYYIFMDISNILFFIGVVVGYIYLFFLFVRKVFFGVTEVE